MKTRFLKFLMAILISTIAGSASANKVKTLLVTPFDGFANAPVIHVYSSDGDAYDSVDKEKPTKFSIGLTAECRSGIKRKKQPYRGELAVAGFELIAGTAPDDTLIPQSSSVTAQFRFVDGNGQPNSAPQICQSELARRLAKTPDKSKFEIMAEGFYIEAPAAFKARYTLTCLSTGFGGTDVQSQSVMVNSKIICEASDLAAAYVPTGQVQIHKVELLPLVTAVTFAATPDEFTSTCPATVVFAGEMTTSRPGTVEYRYVSYDDRISPRFELEFEKAGTLKLPDWADTVTRPPPGMERRVTIPSKPDPAPDPPIKPDSDQERGPDSRSESEPVSAPNDGPDSRSESEPVSAPDDGPDSRSESEPVSALNDGPDSRSESEPVSAPNDGPDSRSESVPVSALNDGPESGPVSEITKQWDITGWHQIEILSPELKTSEKAYYGINCGGSVTTP